MFYKPGKEQNHLRGKGGKRKGAGRQSKFKKEVLKAAEEISRQYLEAELKPVLQTYLQLALSGDGPTLRHYVNKFLPSTHVTIKTTMYPSITKWAAYQSYVDAGYTLKQILRTTLLGRWYFEEKWGYWHPTRFYNIIERIAYSRYIPPEEIRTLAERYCEKWNYDLLLILQHGFRHSSWLYQGAPAKIGECIICTKPFYEKFPARSYFRYVRGDWDFRIEQRQARKDTPDTCNKKFCRDVWGWWLHGGYRAYPDYVKKKDMGIWIMARFLIFLANHKRIRRKYYEHKREQTGQRKGKRNKDQKNEFWFKKRTI